MVPAWDSPGVASNETICGARRNSRRVRATDNPRKRSAVLPTTGAISFVRLAPASLATITVAPMESPVTITVSICSTWLPTETAVMSFTAP